MLPIEHILASLSQQLSSGDAIVVAPPGAGKSTFLPLHLLKSAEFAHKKILMLQPRRIAVRNIAEYLSQQLNESVGQTIGYRIKGEAKVSQNTRLEIVTEGILTRILQNQPELPDVGLVIFDEFHERNLHADFSLALCLEVQQALREDLRLLVMSATLDTQPLSKLMPQAKILHSKGKSYPVDIIYQADNSKRPLAEKVYQLINAVFNQHKQDCLVFLPGASDINKVAALLAQEFEPANSVSICRLYGILSKSEQQLALQPHPKGKRKIVLATNIAETSLTIHGIDCVIDSGIEKRAVFQLASGMTQLSSHRISQASATQRAGRAGRLGPGRCYRMWSKEQQDRLMAQSPAQILQTDMSSFILESAIWGSHICDLPLIDRPTEAQVNQGVEYLQKLGFFDQQQKVTPIAKQAHSLGGHPSLTNLLLKSAHISVDHQNLACLLVALLESKDLLKQANSVSLSERVTYVLQHKSHDIWRNIAFWQKKLGCASNSWPIEDIPTLLALAFPDWVAKHSQNGRYLLANGTGAQLPAHDPLMGQPYLVIANMYSNDQPHADNRIALAEALSLEKIEAHFADSILLQQQVSWDTTKQAIVSRQVKGLGALVLATQPLPKPNQAQVLELWRQVILEKGLMSLPFNDAAKQLIYRCQIAQQVMPELPWPDMSEAGLHATLEQWLLPYLDNVLSWQQLQKLDFYQALMTGVDWAIQGQLKQYFPTSYKVPSGSEIKLNYQADGKVVLAVRMQEMYGLSTTPSIANNSLALELQLLSPAGRILQTTQDLAGFWQGSYKMVQKEMKGRYQKHFWPDDPAHAPATNKTKKRM
ncbi:ATP-dependent helicase HrpB [Paraglaciecola aestuariivivens]